MAQIQTQNWKPQWWQQESHGSAWDRVKEAMHRDWEQTKKDLHVGGKELGQDVGDTVKQATGRAPVPSSTSSADASWNDVEGPMGYGYGAQQQYGQRYSSWNAELESTLRGEWESNSAGKRWDQVKPYVQRGYEYKKG